MLQFDCSGNSDWKTKKFTQVTYSYEILGMKTIGLSCASALHWLNRVVRIASFRSKNGWVLFADGMSFFISLSRTCRNKPADVRRLVCTSLASFSDGLQNSCYKKCRIRRIAKIWPTRKPQQPHMPHALRTKWLRSSACCTIQRCSPVPLWNRLVNG